MHYKSDVCECLLDWGMGPMRRVRGAHRLGVGLGFADGVGEEGGLDHDGALLHCLLVQ